MVMLPPMSSAPRTYTDNCEASGCPQETFPGPRHRSGSVSLQTARVRPHGSERSKGSAASLQ